MITINFNQQAKALIKPCSLTHLLSSTDIENNCYAIILNQHFIPRAHYATTLINDGDVIELIYPMQGG